MANQSKDRSNPAPSSNMQQRSNASLDTPGNTGQGKDMQETSERVVGRAKEQGRSMLEEQKNSAAGKIDSAAYAFRNTAKQLHGEGQAQVSRYVDMFAERLELLGGQLHTKNLDALIRDAENFGRRSPATFLAGSVLAGFALSRFLKSSSQPRRDANDAASDASRSERYSSERNASERRPSGSSIDDRAIDEREKSIGNTYEPAASVSAASTFGDRVTGGTDTATPLSSANPDPDQPGGTNYGNR